MCVCVWRGDSLSIKEWVYMPGISIFLMNLLAVLPFSLFDKEGLESYGHNGEGQMATAVLGV